MPRLQSEAAIQLGWFKNPILIAWYTSGFDNIRNLYFLSRKSSHIKTEKILFFWTYLEVANNNNRYFSQSYPLTGSPSAQDPKNGPWHKSERDIYLFKLKIYSHLSVQSLLPSFDYWAPTIFQVLVAARDTAVNKVSSFSSAFVKLPFYVKEIDKKFLNMEDQVFKTQRSSTSRKGHAQQCMGVFCTRGAQRSRHCLSPLWFIAPPQA